ncbi:radical SAM protein [Desulfopila sp. IMCC35006]|uniref:radical SAM protein n=1 Tax=Desulfopila sp. IMCC35006 TaxID=2569542 RepID=UPI0010ACEF79|nr:radical SAM protein [Desulfopila sp. IMCC35006]TKB24426.1 radical SAM protein [Desulfopila sp. IMCC35006]
MMAEDAVLGIVYQNSGEEKQLLLADVQAALTAFLDHLGVRPLIDRAFFEIIQTGDGRAKLARLLAACGYGDDVPGFLRELLEQLGRADGTGKISINNIVMPHLLLMAILEVVLPGNRFISIKTTEHLEELTNIKLKETDRADLQKVIDTYPVRLSMHTVRQMRVSRNVAYQYLPFVEELDNIGHTNTWIGQFHQGLLEQMYQNRVIFLLNMGCPVYCRFCFRKHKEERNQTNPTAEAVVEAVEHVRNSPSIKEIVITGGDPFMNMDLMASAIDGLMAIEHVQTLRLATRSIAYYPHMFLGDDSRLLNYLKRKNLELQERGKRMEIATHFIHPDEISPQCLMIISELVKNGIGVYVQTPFLKDCNDEGPELVRLFSLLRGAGAELHYIYIPCSPIHGNSVYWSPIAKGLQVGSYLRAHLSDRVVPRICTATPIGKMDWNSSGWAVEPVAGNANFIWIRSPYTPDYFKQFAPIANELENIRVNEEGTIDIQYMAKLGDDRLFLGSRPLRLGGGMFQPESTETVMAAIRSGETLSASLVDTRSPMISRVHETRVEIDANCTEEDLYYIRGDERITDVLIVAENDCVESLFQVAKIIRVLEDIAHVNAVRLRSLMFNYEPERYTAEVIDKLASLNKLTMVNPQRLEIETQFLTPEEFRPEHGRLARLLKNKGITVYNNTPLLGRINDNPDSIQLLAYNCREAGIEFHHLYVAGLPIQNQWNASNPVALYDVVDIATRVRRDGSGREIPRYIIRTVVGEVDFGLSSIITGTAEDLSVQLLPYDISYFKGLSVDFTWPEGVSEDEDGSPIVPVEGLLKTTDFVLS